MNNMVISPAMNDAEMLSVVMSARGERQRTRKRQYMICAQCDNQYLMISHNKNMDCPVCNHKLAFVKTVNEAEANCIKDYARGSLLEQQPDGFNKQVIWYYRKYFINRADILDSAKVEARELLGKE